MKTTVVKFTCDRCKTPWESGAREAEHRMTLTRGEKSKTLDLCAKCFEEVSAFVGADLDSES